MSNCFRFDRSTVTGVWCRTLKTYGKSLILDLDFRRQKYSQSSRDRYDKIYNISYVLNIVSLLLELTCWRNCIVRPRTLHSAFSTLSARFHIIYLWSINVHRIQFVVSRQLRLLSFKCGWRLCPTNPLCLVTSSLLHPFLALYLIFRDGKVHHL